MSVHYSRNKLSSRKQKTTLNCAQYYSLPNKLKKLFLYCAISTVLGTSMTVASHAEINAASAKINNSSVSIHKLSSYKSTFLKGSASQHVRAAQSGNDDDIDAVVDEDAFEDIEDNEFLENEQNSTISATQPLSFKDSQVPLNAISPQTIQTFVEVIDIIRNDYVHPVNDEELFQQAISGMLEKLDNHSAYLTADSYDKLRSFTDGEIGQVGLSASFDRNKNTWIIDTIVPNSSAQDSGIEIGERLISIKNVELVSDMERQDIEQLLSGIAGSQVDVVIANRRGIKRTVKLQRNLSVNNQLTVTVKEGIAIVRLPIFQNSSKEQLINVLRDSGIPITGVVLDIRNNPGGVLTAAIDIASLFIGDSDLIQVSNRSNNSRVIRSTGTPFLSDIPVIVLQNKYSASAAEVLASSLQSNKRAKIVGETSYGKGTVQEVVALKNGGAIKLTVAEYLSADGNAIDGVGVTPDIELAHDGADWSQQAMTLLLSQDRSLGIKFDDQQNGVSVINDY